MSEPMTEEELSRRQKLCRVCGDHATGYNFNVISCNFSFRDNLILPDLGESCKAFFRRNGKLVQPGF
jgi:hypothetical protein